MPLSAPDRKLLAIAVLVLAVLFAIIGIFGSGERDEVGFPSSYNAGRRGGKAAYLLLKQSGYNISRWDQAPGELPATPSGVLLIIVEPRRWTDPQERDALHKFVAAGGKLLLVGTAGPSFAPQSHITRGDYRPAGTECQAVAATGLTRGGPISMDGVLAWDTKADVSHMVHYACKDDAVVISYPLGKGEVIWWASADPLTNAGITEAHNLDLLVGSIGDARRLLWDEYYFGSASGPWSYASSRALKWAALDCAALGLFILITFARRSGPLMPLVSQSRLSPLEFVDTLGKLYHKAGACQAVVEIGLNRFRQLLARRTGLHGQVSAEDMARAIQARRLALPENFAATLARCEDAIADPGLTEREALTLVQRLNDAARSLQLLTEIQEKKDGSNSPPAGPRQERTEQSYRRAAGVR
jgi:hypothetical protein